MKSNRFIVSDETINSHGCIILTSGISLVQFERNPIMLYMHDRDKGVIGRWENIEIKGSQLVADAVFDSGCQLGSQVKHQVEEGFLRAASIGIDIKQAEMRNGIETITECELIEISIVDVPANGNAVKLYYENSPIKDKTEFRRLFFEDRNQVIELKKQLVELLNINKNSTSKEIVKAVENLLNKTDSSVFLVKDAINNGFVKKDDEALFTLMARTDPDAFRRFIKNKQDEKINNINSLIESAINPIILPEDKAIYRFIGDKLGLEVLRQVILVKGSRPSLMEYVSDDPNHSLAYYQYFEPGEILANHNLRKQLIEKERGEYPVLKNLEWYRRNNPEYLQTHPDFYAQLIENESQTK